MPFIKDAFAQSICNPVIPWTCTPAPEQKIGTLIRSLFSFALVIAGLLSFAYLVLGGIQWITSGGDKAGLESARNRIIHAITGLILVASTYAIMMVVSQWLGISFPTLVIPTINQAPPSSVGCIPNPPCQYVPDSCANPSLSCKKLSDGNWYCCP